MLTELRQPHDYEAGSDRCDSMKRVKDLVVPDPIVPLRNSST